VKIRTITSGFNLDLPVKEIQIQRQAEFCHKAREAYQKQGYQVQTIRISFQDWERSTPPVDEMVENAIKIEEYCSRYGIDYFSMGTTSNRSMLPAVREVIKNTRSGFFSVSASGKNGIDMELIKDSAGIIRSLSREGEQGFTNLRFAVLFNVAPNTPFFPAAFHQGAESFGLGTENSDMVFNAFARADTIEAARRNLAVDLKSEYEKLQETSFRLSEGSGIDFDGIDVSIAPSVHPNESIAFGFEKMGLGRFGESGTLFLSKLVTDVLRSLDVKKCGYSGLMLPILEDYGLAERNSQGFLDVTKLLSFSAVCGTGLDTIPLAGDVSEERIHALLLDVAALSDKLNKPLSARLMPIPGKNIGDMTEYTFDYFVNTKIMAL
jgi:uncharacterized protein